MTAPLRVLVALVVLATGLSAQSQLTVVPPAPTSQDEVVVLVPHTCSLSSSTVTRTGATFRVRLEFGPCPSPPFRIDHRVSLGKLEPGEYRVEVTEYTDVPPQVLTFPVFEADPVLTVDPFVVPVDTPGFPIHLRFPDDDFDPCGGEPGCTWTFDIGGVAYRAADQLPAREGTWFYAPDLEPGLHDVRIVTNHGTIVVKNAIYYQAPGATERSIFERVLFPVLFRSSGRNGSEWRSQAVLSNPTDFTTVTANALVPGVSRLEPETRYAIEGEQYPNGVALLVPRRQAEDLAFQLRIRDVSRENASFGTEVPVVREPEMFRDEDITLLDVPLDPRYRTKLRIYFFPDVTDTQWPAYTNVYVAPAGEQGSFLFTMLNRSCSGVACAWTPYYAELDLEARGEGGRADLYVRPIDGGLAWAFASVTNNRTQEVTLITPDGRGGQPR